MEREIGCWGKVNPPLRAARDTGRLWRAFHDGGITCLGSDHGTGGRTRAGHFDDKERFLRDWAAKVAPAFR